MAYATKDFYRNTYKGSTCADDTTLDKWLSRAADDIDIKCQYGIDEDALSDFQCDLLSRANCAQAENYVDNGLDGEFDSLSIGSFSISGGGDEVKDCFSSRAEKFLFEAGLLNSRITCGRYRI